MYTLFVNYLSETSHSNNLYRIKNQVLIINMYRFEKGFLNIYKPIPKEYTPCITQEFIEILIAWETGLDRPNTGQYYFRSHMRIGECVFTLRLYHNQGILHC